MVEAIRPGAMLKYCSAADAAIEFRQGRVEGKYEVKAQVRDVTLRRDIPLVSQAEKADKDPIRRLFELSGSASDYVEGSPVLNDKNQLVGICAKGEGPPRAALIDAEMLATLWTDSPGKQWAACKPKAKPAAGRSSQKE
jgi:hypothetical protein